ncbi:MAG: hypothetical protein JJ895_01065 [Balneolaceae bacterium]|nr:hypothetical protein [Balneolaceae bacterium]
MYQKVILILLLTITHVNLYAQELNFGSDYSSIYSVSISDLNPGLDLDFGLLAKNEGVSSLSMNESKVISIEGVRYLDVYVEIMADEYLLKDGNPSCATNPSCRIPFTLQAAYANRGQNNTAQSTIMNVLSFTATALFPIKYRGNAPPGPPPTPVYSGYNPALFNETAYLYIYGSINVGNVDAGSYTSDITITVSYD